MIVFGTWRQIRERPRPVLRGHALKRLIGDRKRRCPGHSKTSAGRWPWNAGSPIRKSNYGIQRSLPLATGQGTRGASEFIMKSSKSSNLAKRSSCPTKSTGPLSSAVKSAARSPSSASWIESKHLSRFADRSFGQSRSPASNSACSLAAALLSLHLPVAHKHQQLLPHLPVTLAQPGPGSFRRLRFQCRHSPLRQIPPVARHSAVLDSLTPQSEALRPPQEPQHGQSEHGVPLVDCVLVVRHLVSRAHLRLRPVTLRRSRTNPLPTPPSAVPPEQVDHGTLADPQPEDPPNSSGSRSKLIACACCARVAVRRPGR